MSDVVTVGTPVQLIVDGQSKDLPIVTATEGNDGIVVSSLLRDTGMVTVDPGFMNTASCESKITYIDGDEGILRYRGYPIEQLAEHSTFLEVAYLLIHGELPTPGELDAFEERVNRHTLVHEDFRTFMGTFPRHAHPMAVMSSAINALSTFYPESLDPFDPETVELATVLILAKTRTITSYVHRASKGEPLLYPDYSRGYVEDFLRMTFAVPYQQYEAGPGGRLRARPAADPARRPRAELLDVDRAHRRLEPGQPVRVGRGRHQRAVRPAARRRQRGRAEDAHGDPGQRRRRHRAS